MKIEIYRTKTGNQWGFNVNGPTGAVMGGPYPYRWTAQLAAWRAARRLDRRDFRWAEKES